jgi:hypothetical protein
VGALFHRQPWRPPTKVGVQARRQNAAQGLARSHEALVQVAAPWAKLTTNCKNVRGCEMAKRWSVMVALDGNPIPMEMCRCLHVDSLVAVVRAIATSSDARPITIQVVDTVDQIDLQMVGKVAIGVDDLRCLIQAADWGDTEATRPDTEYSAVIARANALLPPF